LALKLADEKEQKIADTRERAGWKTGSFLSLPLLTVTLII